MRLPLIPPSKSKHVGYGQPDRHSIDQKKAKTLVDHFKALNFDMPSPGMKLTIIMGGTKTT